MNQLDHVVIAAPDLAAAKAAFAERTGCTPSDGGQHVGLGTRNALASFGGGQYLEIIAPDPEQGGEGTFAPALAALPEPKLLHWAVRVSGLEAVADRARSCGLAPGEIRETSRAQPDGTTLVWQLMGIGGHELGGLVPFYIDWLDCPHPSSTSPAVGALTRFELTLPERHPAHRLLDGVERVALRSGEPGLVVTFDSSRGPVVYEGGDVAGFRM